MKISGADGATIETGVSDEKRMPVSSTAPTAGAAPTNVTVEDNAAVLMNTVGMKPRGSRADALIEMAGDDMARLNIEEPRKSKMKG